MKGKPQSITVFKIYKELLQIEKMTMRKMSKTWIALYRKVNLIGEQSCVKRLHSSEIRPLIISTRLAKIRKSSNMK